MTKQEMLDEANRLTDIQRQERGTEPWVDFEGKKIKRVGPYIATPEREARAARIIALRRTACRP